MFVKLKGMNGLVEAWKISLIAPLSVDLAANAPPPTIIIITIIDFCLLICSFCLPQSPLITSYCHLIQTKSSFTASSIK